MSSVILSGLTTITTFSLFSDGWENLSDVFEDIKKVGCWIHGSLPENRFLKVVFYGTSTLIFLRLIPHILRNTPYFSYVAKETLYFHRSNNRKEIMAFKQELLGELKEGKHQLPLYNDEKLVILELNIGGATNVSYYPEDCYLIGTDCLEENQELFENNLFLNEDEGIVKNRFIYTIPEELNSVPDNSVSCVVSFHALCSSRKTKRALDEIKRVLIPGGKLYFIEHVSVPQEKRFSLMWLAQMNFRPNMVMMHCSITNIGWYIDNAGFSDVHYKNVDINGCDFQGPLKALTPHIYGYAKI